MFRNYLHQLTIIFFGAVVFPMGTLAHAAAVPAFDHVVVVVEENHGYGDIIGSSQAPYINSLASGGALFTNSFGVTHPSEPNYFAFYAGDTFGVADDNDYTEPGPTLQSTLKAAGQTFTGYVDSGSPRKHNPWESFPEGTTVEKGLNSFPSDFTQLPKVSFVVPNLNNDMHDGSISAGDSWLRSNLDAYATWAKTHNSLLIVTWDEDDFTATNQIATIFYGANVKTGQYTERIDHYSVLRTIEDMFSASPIRNSASASAITDVWNSTNSLPPPASTPSPTPMQAPAGTGSFRVSNGQIIGPNGLAYLMKGVNVYTRNIADVVTNTAAQPLTTLFPGVNQVRIVFRDSYDPPSSIATYVKRLTDLGIVVVLDDHVQGNSAPVASGAALAQELGWFKDMATTFKDNPYVWFQSQNEPGNGRNLASIAAHEVDTYNAVRNTGNNNIVVLEVPSGGNKQLVGVQAKGYDGLGPMTPSAYANMHNIVWDMHFYDFITVPAYSADPTVIKAAFQGSIAGAYGISAVQSVQSGDGLVPVIIGEFGDSTDGLNIDAGGSQLVSVVTGSGFGWSAFTWSIGYPGDNLTQGSSSLTPYGKQIAAAMGNTPASSPSPTPSPNPNPSPTPIPNPPTTLILASQSNVTAGTAVTLTWSSVNAFLCVGTNFNPTGIAGIFTATVQQTTTYSVTCSGPTGIQTSSVTVTVAGSTPAPNPAPTPTPASPSPTPIPSQPPTNTGSPITAAIVVNPPTISAGQSATLTWSSVLADSCTGVNFSPYSTSGSLPVYPQQTTTYTVTCGQGTWSTTLTVPGTTPSANPTPSPSPFPTPGQTPFPTPIPTPTPQGSPSGFAVGARVITFDILRVRSTPSLTATILGTEDMGAGGTIVGGPQTGSGHTWFKIQYDNGLTGWSAQEYLTATGGTTPSPNPSPNPTPTSGMAIPAYARAAGYTQEYFFDDFTSNSIGSGTSGTNWYLNTGAGAKTATGQNVNGSPLASATVYPSATASQVTNGNNGGGSFASPNGGILVLNGPNYPGDGNITIMTTPASSQKSYIPSSGAWQHVFFETYMQFNPNYKFNNLWPAWWFDPQVVVNGKYQEIDGMENFAGNYGYPPSQMSFSGHMWRSNGQNIASGGGAYGTVTGGVWHQTNADSNFHKYGVLWVQTGPSTGYISLYYDDVLQVMYDQHVAGNDTGRIPTGDGGAAGFQDLEVANLFMMFGGAYGTSGNSASQPTANMNVDWVRVVGKSSLTPSPNPTPSPSPTPTPSPLSPPVQATGGGGAVTLIADQSIVKAGTTVNITWTSVLANSCNGSNFQTTGVAGFTPVVVNQTTTYSVTCSGAFGPVSASVTVQIGTYVPPPQPAPTPTPSPTPIPNPTPSPTPTPTGIPSACGTIGTSDWYTYGHDGQHTFASDGCIVGPLTKSWTFAPSSPSGAQLKEVENAIVTSHGVYVKSFNWNSGAHASAMVDKLTLNGAKSWNWRFGDLEEHNWPTFALGKLLVEEDSFWLLDDSTGQSTQMAEYDDWGVNTSDGQRFYSSSNVNSRDSSIGLYVGAWSNSPGSGWPPWIWGQRQYAAPHCGYEIHDSIAVDNGSVFQAGEYVANSGQKPPYQDGMYSYDAANGTRRWMQATTPRSALSVGGGMVFMMEQVGQGISLVARNESTGQVAWTVSMSGTPSIQAPAFAKGFVIVAGSDGVYAFNASNGSQAWKVSGVVAAQTAFTGNPQLVLDPCGGNDTLGAYSDTSVSVALGSGTVVVTAKDGVHILSLSNGGQVWSGQVAGTTGPLKNPVIMGNTLYAVDTGASNGVGQLVAMNSPTVIPTPTPSPTPTPAPIPGPISNTSGSVTIIADHGTVFAGTTVNIMWSSVFANSCIGINFTTTGIAGSVAVKVQQTTSYSVSCNGALGLQTATVLVQVGDPNTTPAPTPSAGGTGSFHVSGGKIIGLNGNTWTAYGINIYGNSSIFNSPGTILQTFPKLNFVRVVTRPLNDAASYDAFANYMTSRGVVVEFEDHPDGGGGQDSSPPQGLAAENAWYASMATHFKGNPYVWFGTFNEPAANSGLNAWQRATYDSIRNTGNNNPIMLEVEGSRPSNLQQYLTPSTYATMTNVIWDAHYYGYINNYSSDTTSIATSITGMITAAQKIQSADGLVPVIIGEMGPSTTGSSLDSNGYATVQGLINEAKTGTMGGIVPFTWYPGFASPNDITDASGNLTNPYGQMVANFIAGNISQTSSGSTATAVTPSSPVGTTSGSRYYWQ